MLEKTPLAETEFNSLYDDAVEGLLREIARLKEKLSELEGQVNWLERENSKYL